jgi:hypothetical protein
VVTSFKEAPYDKIEELISLATRKPAVNKILRALRAWV